MYSNGDILKQGEIKPWCNSFKVFYISYLNVKEKIIKWKDLGNFIAQSFDIVHPPLGPAAKKLFQKSRPPTLHKILTNWFFFFKEWHWQKLRLGDESQWGNSKKGSLLAFLMKGVFKLVLGWKAFEWQRHIGQDFHRC